MRLAGTLALIGSLFSLAGPIRAQDMVLDSVESLLREGAAWQATQLLQDRLSTASTRTPEVLMAGGRAAAGWRGWSTVWSLLHERDWLDGRFDRLGHRLLAEAALARDDTEEALGHARLSLVSTVYPRSDEERARRLIVLARAHQRDGSPDSAAAAYTRAAPLFPEISDWLALRAAAVTSDSATRHRLYATVTNRVARTRIGWTEAAAWSRLDEKARAAKQYAAVGDVGSSLRLRWEANSNSASRARVATEALAIVRAESPNGELSQVLDLIDSYRLPMARSESLMVARLSSSRRPSFATRLFSALARGGGGIADRDRMAWGDALASQGNWAAAATTYRTIENGDHAGRSAYLAARADLRRNRMSDAVAQLRSIPTRFPGDTFAAATALYLLSDLALDAANPDSARRLLRRIVERYPTAQFAPRGALVAPLIAFAAGEYRTARQELSEAIERRILTGFNADAGRYWLGRSLQRLGETTAANLEFRRLIERGPENYYAIKAAERLDSLPWRAAPRVANAVGTTPPALVRSELLDALGLTAEARHELLAFGSEATTATELLAAGSHLVTAGQASRAHRFALRAISAGASRQSAWELLYPLPFSASLVATSTAADLDPWLVAAVIKQESWFEPRATSRVGARGLMQVMPSVGKNLARRAGLQDFDDALLWQPEVSLGLGTIHFAEAMRRYPERERALAAYNAGGTRVTNWSRTLLDGRSAGGGQLADAELFVERIPYLETRGYIRNITVNEAMYRLVYD